MYKDDLWKIFSVREGGMAIYGGVLAGVFAGWAFSRVRKLPFLALADLAAPSLALGQAVGRWGNFVNQEAYGYAVTDPALCHFPLSVFIEADGRWHLATFFYESVLVFSDRRLHPPHGAPGQAAPPGRRLFVVSPPPTARKRAVVEGLRTDSLMLGPVRISQLLAALLAAGSLIALIVRARRKNA